MTGQNGLAELDSKVLTLTKDLFNGASYYGPFGPSHSQDHVLQDSHPFNFATGVSTHDWTWSQQPTEIPPASTILSILIGILNIM